MEKRWSHKKILLVYPEIPKATYWSMSKALEFIDKRSGMPPLGLLTVAAMLPETYELRLRDLNVEPLTDEDLGWADSVFVSAMIVQKDSFENVVRRVKAHGLTVVAGGPYPSSFYYDVEGVDHLVIGEAEAVFGAFLEDFEAGCAKKVYARPVREEEFAALVEYYGDEIDASLSDGYVDIDKAPLPRFDLIDNRKYYQSMALQTSRGCPVGCEFCDIWRRFGKKARIKSFDTLEKEFNKLAEFGWSGSLFLVDDNFIGHKGRAKELLRNIIRWQQEHGYPFDLYTEVTLTLADDDELMSLMRDAGFDFVFVGIETPAEESLVETRKFINTRGTMSEKVAKIQGYGMQVAAGFIIGFDNDPDDIADRMINCIQNLGIPTAMVGLLQALPDTDLGERLRREGRMLTGSTGNNTHEFSLNFATKRPMDEVVRDYKRVLQSIYPLDLKAYFERCSVLRRIYRHNPNLSQRTELVYLKALAKFMWESLFRRYRWNCWKFMITTMFTNPRFFSMAATLSVQGHHFREITRLAFEMEELKEKFAKRLSKVVGKLRRDIETGYVAGGIQVEKYAKLMEKRRMRMNRYVHKRLDAMSRKYGLPVQQAYGDFRERLEIAFAELQMEYGLLGMPVPARI
jgi:radical SAM superfamily enzyme YgiQ (UPF0313 family)